MLTLQAMLPPSSLCAAVGASAHDAPAPLMTPRQNVNGLDTGSDWTLTVVYEDDVVQSRPWLRGSRTAARGSSLASSAPGLLPRSLAGGALRPGIMRLGMISP